ncbi:MAG: N-acetylneuraminate synthase family protein [Deltaproteobacteria bacterium]|nr:N-acetylneuraminate synthase family protein [Deltaproteobacteria bacterium]
MSFLKELSGEANPFIIAEIGVNYYDIAEKYGISVIEAAKKMILSALESGAHAVKFQSYKAGKIASKNSPAYWDQTEEPTNSQYELFKKFDHFGEEEYRELARFTEKTGGIFCSTPFDFGSADYLEELMPFYKISSSDITNLPFIRHISEKGKPVLLSTGASTIGEIERAVAAVEETGNTRICIMHCVLSYPTMFEDANLNMIKHLRAVFPDYISGYSDHTRPDFSMMVLTTAWLYGAQVIEKHFTLDKTLKGNDHYHAMDPDDLKIFVNNCKMIKEINGQYRKEPLACETGSRKQARRSIVAVRNLNEGEILSKDMVTFKRPGAGISPGELEKVLGRKLKKNLPEDEFLTWEHL